MSEQFGSESGVSWCHRVALGSTQPTRTASAAFVLGLALACSGEPFTGLANPQGDGTAGSAGSGGSPPAPFPTMPSVVAGGGSPAAERSGGGTNTTPSEPEPPAGGGAGAPDGSPQSAGGDANPPAVPACATVARDDWELGFFPELREASTQESHPYFQVTNRGAVTTLDRVSIRYYFTKESPMPETAVCYWVTGDRCHRAKLEFGDVPTPTADASRYLQVSFPGASDVTLAAERLEVRVGFKSGSAPLIQTNDYSFDPNAAAPESTASFPYKRWLKTTLYLNGELVWGAEPCVLKLPVRARRAPQSR